MISREASWRMILSDLCGSLRPVKTETSLVAAAALVCLGKYVVGLTGVAVSLLEVRLREQHFF